VNCRHGFSLLYMQLQDHGFESWIPCRGESIL